MRSTGTSVYVLLSVVYRHTYCSPITQNLDYNVPGGKLNRGISVVDGVEILRGRPLSDDEYFKAAVLGWGVEFVSAPPSPLMPCDVDVDGDVRSFRRSSSFQTI